MPYNLMPYTNLHELNLDWIIARIKEINETRTETAGYAAEAKLYRDAAGVHASNALASSNSATMAMNTAQDAATLAGERAGQAAASATQAQQYAEHIADPVAGLVTQWLQAHVDPDTGYVIDNTLTVAGAAADAKTVGDNIDKYDNPFEETIPAYTNGIVSINIIDPAESNYTSYRISVIRKNSSWHWFMTLQGHNGTDWVNIDNIASEYNASAVYPRVETLFSNYNKYVVVIDWDYVRTEDISTSGITGIILKNTVVNRPFINTLMKISTDETSIATLTTNEQMYNSVFSVPVNSNALGIVDINVYHAAYTNYEKYRVNIIRHNNLYHLHLVLQGYDGAAWTNIDTILVNAESAPVPIPPVEVLDSNYHRFTATVIWSMMGNLSLTNLDYQLKNSVVNRAQIGLQTQINNVSAKADIPSFELADHIKHVITVKADGTGNYSSIAAAYASITDSALDNQYEIVVYPGTYNENNLQPPAYTHTHGIYPMLTIVDSTGLYDPANPDLSVFDQGHAPSKLSNMMIKSQTKYCVHQDIELKGVTLINENLYCIRLAGGSSETSVIGIGADFDGAKFIWRNCTFVNGAVAAHTNPNNLPNANQHLIYDHCTFVDAYVSLMVAGIGGGASGNTFGEYVCEVKGCKTNKGTSGLNLKCGYPVTGVPVNFPWQIIGGDNNFAPVFNNSSDTSVTDFWDAISTTEKQYVTAAETISKGKAVTITGMIANASTERYMIAGIAVKGGATGDRIPVWTSALKYTGANGEYGINSAGELSSTATIKTGYVYNGIYYPYNT